VSLMTTGSYVVNDRERPIRFGEVEIENRETRATLKHERRKGILCHTVITGFCGSDYEFMKMGRELNFSHKFPAGKNRLINGHEGVLYVPEWKKFAVLSVRGGEAVDPSRFRDDETYFEYGCDKIDGIMSYEGFFNPDLLIPLSDKMLSSCGKIPLSLAKKLCFADPAACVLFQKERIRDLLSAHNFRLYLTEGLHEEAAREKAFREGFQRVVIFGCGGTGLPAAMLLGGDTTGSMVVVARGSEDTRKIRFLKENTSAVYVRSNIPEEELAQKIINALGGKASLFFTASGTSLESKIAFDHGVLANNGIYVSFSVGPRLDVDTMGLGFKNQLIFGAINFRKEHMEKSVEMLRKMPLDHLVKIYPLEKFRRDPVAFYHKVYVEDKGVVKAAVLWREELIDMEA